MDSLTDLTAFIGGIAGFISLAIIIYKTYTEKPILKFTFTDAYFWNADTPENPMTGFSISLSVSNKGQRSTTIHKVSFSFTYEKKIYSPEIQVSSIVTPIPPDDTKLLLFSFYLKPEDGRFTNDIDNGKLIIEHTHKEITICLPKIRKIK